MGSVLHCALLLLGYKSSSYEVEADANMFDKSNTKGMEAVLHFLLSRLRGSLQAKKDFKGLWPIMDTRQQRDYRKVVHTLLSDIEHAGRLPRRLMAALQSMFTTAAGSRVTELLCHLACNALGQQMQGRYSHELQHTCHGQSQGESGPTGADAASYEGRCRPKQAAAHQIPQKCSRLLHHAGSLADSC